MGIPRQILLLCLTLACVGVATAWLGWLSVESYVEGEEEWLQPDNHSAWTAVIAGILSFIAIGPVLARWRFASKLALICYSLAIGALLPKLPDPFYWSFIELLLDFENNDVWYPVANLVLSPRTTWFYFALALLIGYGMWIVIELNQSWFRGRGARAPTTSARKHWSGPIIVLAKAAVVWLLLS